MLGVDDSIFTTARDLTYAIANKGCKTAEKFYQDYFSLDARNETIGVLWSADACFRLLPPLLSKLGDAEIGIPQTWRSIVSERTALCIDGMNYCLTEVLGSEEFIQRVADLLNRGALPKEKRGKLEFIETPSRTGLDGFTRFVAFVFHLVSQAYLWRLAQGVAADIKEKDLLIHPIMDAVSWMNNAAEQGTLSGFMKIAYSDIDPVVVDSLVELRWAHPDKVFVCDSVMRRFIN